MRITWFGGNCIRLQISDHSICFFPQSADAQFLRSALETGAQIVEADRHAPFEPFHSEIVTQPKRLIDAMDVPDQFYEVAGHYLVRSEPDEVFLFVSQSAGEGAAIMQNAGNGVVTLVGTCADVMSKLRKAAFDAPRQYLFALFDEEHFDVGEFLPLVGKTPVQVLAAGETIEL